MRWTVYARGQWLTCEEHGGSFRVLLNGTAISGSPFRSLFAAASGARAAVGMGWTRKSGREFWAIDDDERCEGCGVALTAFHPKVEWKETYELLKSEQRGGKRRHVTRATVLGKMKELREIEWRLHREQCESAAAHAEGAGAAREDGRAATTSQGEGFDACGL